MKTTMFSSPVGAAYSADVAPTELNIFFEMIFYKDAAPTVLMAAMRF